MKCEFCGKEHDGSFGSGRFCNRKCANSFSMSKDVKSTKIVKCCVCGKEIEVDKRASGKLCKCDDCRKTKKWKSDGLYKNCLNCGKKLNIKQKKFCSKKCSDDYKYEEIIKKWKNEDFDGLKSHGNAISSHIRRYLWEKYDGKCSRCGWNTPNPVTGKPVLEIEHIDGNSNNNREENLDLICPNCHSLTSTYRALNKGNGNRKRLKYYKLI